MRTSLLLSLVVLAFAAWGGTVLGTMPFALEKKPPRVEFVACSTNDEGTSIDPGGDRHVGSAECSLYDRNGDGHYETILAHLERAYPGYAPTVFFVVRNTSPKSARVVGVTTDGPSWIAWEATAIVGLRIPPRSSVPASVAVAILDSAPESLLATSALTFAVASATHGDPDFWKHCASGGAFTRSEIESWLRAVDDASACLGPRTVSGMVRLLDRASSRDAVDSFLAHYLALRLNVESGVLPGHERHDVRSVDPNNVLRLPNPAAATLLEIVEHIEAEWRGHPDRAVLAVMRRTCQRLNGLII